MELEVSLEMAYNIYNSETLTLNQLRLIYPSMAAQVQGYNSGDLISYLRHRLKGRSEVKPEERIALWVNSMKRIGNSMDEASATKITCCHECHILNVRMTCAFTIALLLGNPLHFT